MECCCDSAIVCALADWTTPGSVDKPRLSIKHMRPLVSAQSFTPEFREEAVEQVKHGAGDVSQRARSAIGAGQSA